MAELKTLHLAHLPPSLAVHVALYQDVKNAVFLRQQLLAGNAEFEYALIDASMIISTTHVLAAVFRAANDLLNDRLKSRNVHSEIVFALSPNNNIAESFRRFGVADATTNLLVIKVTTSTEITHDVVQQHLGSSVEGKPIDFSDQTLAQMTDLARVKKVYKLSAQAATKGRQDARGNSAAFNGKSGAMEDDRKEIEVNVVGLMALRGAT
ncbi:protein cgi121 [Lasallia pustulata]|uniref:EKC/KEOPS complex subunit CGI121 n=1 Tax=Lasallia pustulata TaxID=136370 RepID=A0A1W5D3K4_9LECA|nr:protein cgi121 [Lasallia pustulata]